MKKFIVILLLLASLFCIASSAFAGGNWTEIFRDNNYIIYINPPQEDSYGMINVWIKAILRSRELKNSYKHKSIDYTMEYWQFNTNNKTMRVLDFTAYNKKGFVVEQSNIPNNFEAIAPGTLGDIVLSACKSMLGIY